MEHKVGETFKFRDVILKVVVGNAFSCNKCYFRDGEYCNLRINNYKNTVGPCSISEREDQTDVYFEQVNKDMEEKLDLTKILDGCPQDTEFYSDTFGVLRFRRIDTSAEYPLVFRDTHYNTRFFTSDGKFFMSTSSNCKLSIFPSDTQRDWNKFERFWDKTKVKRYDTRSLKPFDKVLVRDYTDHNWSCNLFSYIYLNNKSEWLYIGLDRRGYRYCIPYNDETKHLLGTFNEAPEYYRYWEDDNKS